jgi:hypothetical protein
MAPWECKVTRSDLSTQEQNEVRAIVNQALVICKSYRECAAFCKLALERHFGDDSILFTSSLLSTTWCVVAGHRISFKVRQQRLHTCVIHAPGLVLLEKIESNAKPFSIVIWRGCKDSDENLTEVFEENNNDEVEEDQDAKSILVKTNSLLVGKRKLSEYIKDKKQRELLPSPLSIQEAGSIGGVYILQSTMESFLSLLHLVSLVSLARQSCGLDSNVDGLFLDTLKASLTKRFGSTWHLLLSDLNQNEFEAARETFSKNIQSREVNTNERLSYIPGYSVSSRKGFFLELSLLSLKRFINTNPEGTIKNSSQTPERYSLCIYRSTPGEGEPSAELNSASASISRLFLPGWDGRTISLPRAMWRNSVLLTRTTLYAIALGCLSSYSFILFWYNNSCSRVLRPTVDALGVDLESLEARLLTTGPFSGAVARRFALGPLPPLQSNTGDDRISLVMGKDETLSSGIRGALHLLAAAFRFVPNSERYFDSLLPPLPVDVDSFDEFIEKSGLSPDCSVIDVLYADRRALQARALITSAVLVFLLASIIRVFSTSFGKSRLRGKLRGLSKSVTRS